MSKSFVKTNVWVSQQHSERCFCCLILLAASLNVMHLCHLTSGPKLRGGVKHTASVFTEDMYGKNFTPNHQYLGE